MKRIFSVMLVLALLLTPAAAFADGEDAAPADPKEEAYLQALADLEAGDYDAAEKTFVRLTGYRDAAEQIRKTRYLRGISLKEKGDYLGAYKALISVSGYEDAKEQAAGSLNLYCTGLLKAKNRTREKLAEEAYYFEWLRGDELYGETYEAWRSTVRVGIGDPIRLRISGSKSEKYRGDMEIESVTVSLASKDTVAFTFRFTEHTKQEKLSFTGMKSRTMRSDRKTFGFEKTVSGKAGELVIRVKLKKALATKYLELRHYVGSGKNSAYTYAVLNYTAVRKILELSTEG